MTHPPITNVDRLDDGIVVSYSNGTVQFVPAAYLWEHRNDFSAPMLADLPPIQTE